MASKHRQQGRHVTPVATAAPSAVARPSRSSSARGEAPKCADGESLYVVLRGRINKSGDIVGEGEPRNVVALTAEQAERFRDGIEPYNG